MNRRIETGICFVVLASIALSAGAAPTQNPGESSTWIDVERSRSASGAGSAAAAAPPVVEVREDASRIDISFTISGYSREIVEVEGNNYTRLSLPGTGLSGEEGHPALPFKGLFVEIPYGVEVAQIGFIRGTRVAFLRICPFSTTRQRVS